MNNPHISTRQRRQKERKNAFLVRILISVVALIECLILLSFTTYSWIESSSSLIISTGKEGMGIRDPKTGEYVTMSVANNLNYQVEVSADAAGSVNLKQDDMIEDDGGFYRTVRYFNYSRTSSPDGKTFFFKKTKSTSGETGAISANVSNPYRIGDTADYNTSYTYLDFEINNTTAGPKDFYFNSENIFSIMDGNSEIQYANMADNQKKIVDALRISLEQVKGDGTAEPIKIFSLKGNSAEAINAVNGSHETKTSTAVIDSNYIYTGKEDQDVPVFTVNSGNSNPDKVSIRIWFEMTDKNLEEGLDDLIASTNIKINLEFKSDGVDYDQIYFDDYAFSQKADQLGKFVTEENPAYSMYLHAYNSKEGIYLNYPMTKVRNNDTDATRWMVSVPIPYVIEERNSDGELVSDHDFLTNTSNMRFSDAYFFYGTASATTTTPPDNPPTHVMYKWSLPGAMSIATPKAANRNSTNQYVITDATRYFRNLGVVRNETTEKSVGVANYVSGTTAEPINGFLQFHNSSDPMQMVYLRDQATGYTATVSGESTVGSPYNLTSETDPYNYQYITRGRSSYDIVSTATTQTPASETFDTTGLEHADQIYYVDIPKGAQAQFYTSGMRNNQYEEYLWQTSHSDAFVTDGACYTTGDLTNEGSKEYYLVTYTPNITLPTLNDPGYIRIYFYNKHLWNPLKINVFATSIAAPSGGYQTASVNGMTTGTTGSSTTQIEETLACDHLYLNRGSSNMATTQTVRMYYDTRNNLNLFKAYVPSSWLNANSRMTAHYNRLNYYDDTNDALRWGMTASSAASGDVYTLLGYSDATNIAALSAGTGIGTWDEVREMRFDTELIDSNIAAAYRYKVSTAAGDYPMIPVDSLCFTFKAWVPVSGLDNQSTQSVLSFKRFSAYNNNTEIGTWTPAENITDTETVYYAVDADGGNSNSNHGWFHVAVLTDATFENLVYETVAGTNATLQYSYDGAADHYSAVTCRIDKRRWVVPMKQTASGTSTIHDLVFFKWTPYPATNTVFTYMHNTSDGIYCVITEAAGE